MTRLVAAAVILNESATQVLLIRRRDYRAWGLPGGKFEPGETPAQAAQRETREETGLDVEIIALVGQYRQPQFGDLRHIFRARPIGGRLLPDRRETLAAGWFPVDTLPHPLMPWTAQIVQDALSEPTLPVERELRVPGWQAALARAWLAIRPSFRRFMRTL